MSAKSRLLGLLGALVFASTGYAGVVINEVDYDQPGIDSAEWVELHNPDPVAQPLTGLLMVFFNGGSTGCPQYRSVDLGVLTIPANGYVVIGNGVACATTLVGLGAATDAIQNGAPDVVMIVNNNTGGVLDAIEYEQAGTSACFFFAVTTPATDSNTVAGSIQRCSSGWLFGPSTPCAPNNCTVANEQRTWSHVKSLFE